MARGATDRLLILFGTQTGNAKDVAEQIDREARRRGRKTQVLAMDAFDLSLHQKEPTKAIFIASTTGQGEVPSNMQQFWRLIMKRGLSTDLLNTWNYAIFGLGDSGYIDYNVVAKKLDRRLAGLGAQQIVPRGLGDDQHTLGYEAALEPWLTALWDHLRLAPDPSAAVLDTPRYKVTVLPANEQKENGLSACEQHANGKAESRQAEAVRAAYEFSRLEAAAAGIADRHETTADPVSGTISDFGPANPCMARLLTNIRITAADHFQDTRHIEFDLGQHGPTYDPGDIITIFPSQDRAAVAEFLNWTGYNAKCRMRIELADAEPNNSGQHAMEARLDDFIMGALDVDSASPRRYFFEVLQHFATHELQKERLQHFASSEGREDLNLYNQSEGRTVLEVLRDFSSARPPLEWLIQLCPRLQPRQFSIACSQRAHPQQAHITLAVVDYRTPFKRRKRGLCSNWLANLRKGGIVPVWVEKGVLHLPKTPMAAIVMIGPGTGIAPFRAFLEERESHALAGEPIGPSYLYFGCRSRSKDYYYRDQFEAMQRTGILAKEGGLQVACSRDQPQKIYVQQLLAENSRQLFSLICQGATMYVSGSAQKMPQDVASVFKEVILQQGGGLSSVDAQKTMRLLTSNNRYVVEAWS